ncbi:uncharacterized protein B0H18DRAFT_1220704 [Fomitopsis serialis]|uniref:uncharacterized protein n=1 Tax=Fomitopsis serialis TaxID=139415 RepID=UPI002007CFB6|nr:uncharacterized protein B0H18DRAFT_1220704 [Neoantrodia serialis]KAH9905518.1 hypothetical protein B0H18DRAFT_1220704 [Neoantrodia serialis]
MPGKSTLPFSYPVAATRTRPAISKLPMELLLEIFITLSEVIVKRERIPVVASDIVAHVCRDWRTLALSTSRLWCRIIATERCSPFMVQERLKRSKTRPLEVQILGPSSSADFSENILLAASAMSAHTKRVKWFALTGFDLDSTERIAKEFSGGAPILRALHIEAHVQNASQGNMAARALTLFGGHMPDICRATIVSAPVSLDPFFGLKKLSLQDQDYITVTRVLSTLRRCPGLQVLQLGFAEHCWDEDLRYPTEPINSPCLKQLLLDGEQDEVLHTLAHISFPTTTTVVLRMLHASSTADHVPHCKSFQAITSTLKHAILEFAEVPGYASFKFSIRSPDRRVVAEFEWLMADEEDGIHGQPSMRFEVLRLSALEHLTVTGLPRSKLTHSADWGRIFAMMPALTAVDFEVKRHPSDPAELFSPVILALKPGLIR